MKQNLKKFFGYFSSLALLLLPVLAAAQNDVKSGLGRVSAPFGSTLGVNSSSSVLDLIVFIIRLLLGIGGAIAVLYVIIGGYRYITSAGNEETAEKGKNTVVNALIGIVLIILSYVIINVVVNTVSGTGSFFSFF